MQVIIPAFDSRDGVFIGGKHLHYTFKPMTNNELTLDQLSVISGGKLSFRKPTSAKGLGKKTHEAAINSMKNWKERMVPGNMYVPGDMF